MSAWQYADDCHEAVHAIHRALAVPSRAAIFAELRRSDRPLSVPEVAHRVERHANTVRRHLGVLEKVGLVHSRAHPSRGPGRPALVYEVESADCGDTHGAYRLLGKMLAGAVVAGSDDPVAASEKAGETWGRHLAGGEPLREVSADQALERLADVHRDLGLEPTVTYGVGVCVALHDCPFAEVAEGRLDVVCGIHRGLVRGLLAQLGAPLQLVAMTAVADCGRYVIRLAETPGSEPQPVA